MAITKLSKDLNIIAKLDNEPNDVGGLTPDQLKAKFDEGGNEIKEYINKTLISDLEATTAAASLGVAPVGSSPKEVTKLQDMLEYMNTRIDDATAGQIPERSLEGNQLKVGAVTDQELGEESVRTRHIKDGEVTNGKIKSITKSKISDFKVVAGDIDEGAVRYTAIYTNAVRTDHIYKEAVTAEKIAKNAVTAAKILNGEVSADKIAANAVSNIYTCATKTDDWVKNSSGLWEQTLTVSGMKSTDTPVISFYTGVTNPLSIERKLVAYSRIYQAVANNNSITFTAYEKPDENINLRMLCVRK